MDNHFLEITDTKEFAELVSRSKERPVVIFKHSTTCPMSAAAYQEMTGFDGEVSMIEVQSARKLSREIEKRTGIAHESPQIIVLHNGKVVWNASHSRVKAEAVAEAVRQARES